MARAHQSDACSKNTKTIWCFFSFYFFVFCSMQEFLVDEIRAKVSVTNGAWHHNWQRATAYSTAAFGRPPARTISSLSKRRKTIFICGILCWISHMVRKLMKKNISCPRIEPMIWYQIQFFWCSAPNEFNCPQEEKPWKFGHPQSHPTVRVALLAQMFLSGWAPHVRNSRAV